MNNVPSSRDLGTAVLVHGAGHTGWCWFLVADRLARAGVRVRAPDLPLKGLTGDIAMIREQVATAKADGPVTVVAHSMSGIQVAAAGHRADRLIFVAAALPLEGEVQTEALKDFAFPEALAQSEFAPDGSFTFTPGITDYVYNETPVELRREAVTRLRTTATAFPAEPLPDPAWRTVPSAYVVCRKDRCCPPDWQRGRAALLAESIELEADHAAFFSAPDELSAFIVAQAKKAAADLSLRAGTAAPDRHHRLADHVEAGIVQPGQRGPHFVGVEQTGLDELRAEVLERMPVQRNERGAGPP